jgi:16S rRNA (guanine1207-N2)-methyltransferase
MKNSSQRSFYNQVKEFTVSLRGEPIHVFSKPGMPHWDRMTSASQLLADNIQVSPSDKVLLSGSAHGALAVCLARLVPQGCLQVSDTNLVCINLTKQTLEANAIRNTEVRDLNPFPTEKPGWFDVVVMVLPKGRKLARRWLVEAYTALKNGGILYLAGPNQEGIQPVIKDGGELFGGSVLLDYRKGNRVARLIKREGSTAANPSPSWASEPGIQPGTWHAFSTVIQGKEYTIHNLPGVFSYNELDEGTALLLDNLAVPNGSRVLDFGCGYGIIGLVAASLGAGQVDLVDADLLAVTSSRENIRINGIEDITAFPADGLAWAKDRTYDLLVTNPPFHNGKEVDFDITEAFIEQAPRVLNPGGKLVLVANRFLRYTLQLKSSFGNVDLLAKNNRFHVLSSTYKP